MKRKLFILLPLLMLCITGTHFAQESNRIIANDHLNALQNGTLILVLDSKSNQINAIEKVLENERDATSFNYKYYTKQLIEIDSTLAIQKVYHDVIRDSYNYSDLKVIWDDDLQKLMNKHYNITFLDKELKPDPSISIDSTKAIYTLKYSNSKKTENYGTEAWLIRTQDLKEIKKPFPGTYKYNFSFIDGFKQFLSIEPSRTKHRERARDIVQEINLELRTRF